MTSEQAMSADKGDEWEAGVRLRYHYGIPQDLLDELAADHAAARETRRLEERIESLFPAIEHGDDDHRAWLKEAITAHFAGESVLPPRGSGRLEERVRELEAALRFGQHAPDGHLRMMVEVRGLGAMPFPPSQVAAGLCRKWSGETAGWVDFEWLREAKVTICEEARALLSATGKEGE